MMMTFIEIREQQFRRFARLHDCELIAIETAKTEWPMWWRISGILALAEMINVEVGLRPEIDSGLQEQIMDVIENVMKIPPEVAEYAALALR